MWKRKKQYYGLLWFGCLSLFQFIFDLFTRRRSSAGREGKTIGLHAVELIFPLLGTIENVVYITNMNKHLDYKHYGSFGEYWFFFPLFPPTRGYIHLRFVFGFVCFYDSTMFTHPMSACGIRMSS